MKTNFLVLLILPLLWNCSNENSNDEEYVNLPLELKAPSNFPPLAYNLTNNPPTVKGFELGKKLFYDGRLASDGIVSCGFCHEQANAFTHHGHTFSHGVGESIGTRNAPPIQNMAFQNTFMWDGTAQNLDLQPIIPFTSPIEMNGNFATALAMMAADPVYVKLYKQAFVDGKINSENMLKALGQFQSQMISANSRFDKFRRNEVGGTLTQPELDGYATFNQKCASCHATDIFTDNSFRNNGLQPNSTINDIGRFRFTQLEQDKYKFKVPSLRNIEKTAPYMHDGRFFNLDGVLEHYDSGMTNVTGTIDSSLTFGTGYRIPLSATEKANLKAFLLTLTDNEYLTDKRFSEY